MAAVKQEKKKRQADERKEKQQEKRQADERKEKQREKKKRQADERKEKQREREEKAGQKGSDGRVRKERRAGGKHDETNKPYYSASLLAKKRKVTCECGARLGVNNLVQHRQRETHHKRIQALPLPIPPPSTPLQRVTRVVKKELVDRAPKELHFAVSICPARSPYIGELSRAPPAQGQATGSHSANPRAARAGHVSRDWEVTADRLISRQAGRQRWLTSPRRRSYASRRRSTTFSNGLVGSPSPAVGSPSPPSPALPKMQIFSVAGLQWQKNHVQLGRRGTVRSKGATFLICHASIMCSCQNAGPWAASSHQKRTKLSQQDYYAISS
jgi:hypothetical protein